jgi:hypothetical protein
MEVPLTRHATGGKTKRCISPVRVRRSLKSPDFGWASSQFLISAIAEEVLRKQGRPEAPPVVSRQALVQCLFQRCRMCRGHLIPRTAPEDAKLMEPLSLTPILKPSFEIIRDTIGLLRGIRGKKRHFWLKQVLEPLQSAMSTVHETYIRPLMRHFSFPCVTMLTC